MTLSPRFTSIAWIAAALTFLAGLAVTPWESSTDTADYLTTIGTHSGQAQIAAVLLHFGVMLMVPAYFGLYWLMRDRAGKLGLIGGVLATFGAVGMAGTLVVDFYAIALQHNLPIDQAAKIEEAAQGMAGTAVIQMTSAIPMVIGAVLLVIAAYRNGLAPLWAAIVLPIGMVSPMAGAPMLAVVAGVVLLAVALGITHRLSRGAREGATAVDMVRATA